MCSARLSPNDGIRHCNTNACTVVVLDPLSKHTYKHFRLGYSIAFSIPAFHTRTRLRMSKYLQSLHLPYNSSVQ